MDYQCPQCQETSYGYAFDQLQTFSPLTEEPNHEQ